MVEIKPPLDNAVIKYTPVLGRVEVPTRDFEDRVELEVSDTETRTTEEQLPHVFERFHRGGLLVPPAARDSRYLDRYPEPTVTSLSGREPTQPSYYSAVQKVEFTYNEPSAKIKKPKAEGSKRSVEGRSFHTTLQRLYRTEPDREPSRSRTAKYEMIPEIPPVLRAGCYCM